MSGPRLSLTDEERRRATLLCARVSARWRSRSSFLDAAELQSIAERGAADAVGVCARGADVAFESLIYDRIHAAIRSAVKRERQLVDRLHEGAERAIARYASSRADFCPASGDESVRGRTFDDAVLGALAAALLGLIRELEPLKGDEIMDCCRAYGELIAAMYKAIWDLPELQERMTDRHYFSGDDMPAIAREMNLTPGSALRLHQAATSRLGRSVIDVAVSQAQGMAR